MIGSLAQTGKAVTPKRMINAAKRVPFFFKPCLDRALCMHRQKVSQLSKQIFNTTGIELRKEGRRLQTLGLC